MDPGLQVRRDFRRQQSESPGTALRSESRSAVKIIAASELAELPPPQHESARRARRYLEPLIQQGASAFVDNADVLMLAIAVGGEVMPLVVSDEKPGNSDVCSPYAHYVSYTLAEMARKRRILTRTISRPTVFCIGAALRAAHLDRVVYVNNWLLPTNPSPRLSAGDVGEIVSCLEVRYPDRAIVFRSVNPRTQPVFHEALRANKSKLVASRKVYLVDASNDEYTLHEGVRRDSRLLKATPYETVGPGSLADSDITRITQLYRNLYLIKHNALNPQFNERFFRLVIREDIFKVRALRMDGRIDAFVSYYSDDRVMTGAMLGYDTGMPRKLGLYRLAIAMLMDAARERQLLLNLSGGVGSFKMLRGAVPCIEYDAVFDRHLPRRRRIAWNVLRFGASFQ